MRKEIFQKIDIIVERLEAYKLHNPQSAILSYSGGRDSHLLLHILRNVLRYNNSQFPAVYAKTYNEYHDIRRRIEQQDITIVDNGRRVFEVFEKEGLPLWGKKFSKYWNDIHIKKWNIRFTNETILKDYTERCEWVNVCGFRLSEKCCKLLKEDVLQENKSNIVGLRMEEKGRRAEGKTRNMIFVCEIQKLFSSLFLMSAIPNLRKWKKF